jgi:acid phosphatase
VGAGSQAAQAQEAPAPVRFAVKGDWGTGLPAQAAVTRRMCAEARRSPFAFVLTTGDNFYAPDGRATLGNFWRPERCLRALRIPWRAAWGNHDLAGDSTATALGSPRRYYAFGAGPARVVVLDANDPDDPGQLAFMRAELDGGGAGARIVAFHQPLQSAGLHAPDPEQRRLWTPLLRRGGVDLVLQGHNHGYERLVVGGITYITTGGGGAPLYPCVRPVAGLRSCRFAHHFLAVTVGPHAISVRAIGPRGTTIERVRIPVA